MTNRARIGLLSLLVACAPAAAVELEYEVVFDATWSESTHPVDYPPNAHFSPPIGVMHNATISFWELGQIASDGIEEMAETGFYTILWNDMIAAAALDQAAPDQTFGEFIFSPGQTISPVTASDEFHLLTWVSMLAPSPDWFVGVSGLDLRPGGMWVESITVPLVAYDAGSDDGPTFFSANADTQPPEPITLIATAPLAPNPPQVPVGSLTVRLLPLGDPDSDGLSTRAEAQAGTDPLDPDTDDDGFLDGSDNCPASANPDQADQELDGVGDLCDNCPMSTNLSQRDADQDGEGDVCDADDGLIYWVAVTRGSIAWQDEPSYTEFNVYRGDLTVLRQLGAAAITQAPDGGSADRFCGLTSVSILDGYVPPAGAGVYYLVTGVASGVESAPGFDSDGAPRGNPAACP